MRSSKWLGCGTSLLALAAAVTACGGSAKHLVSAASGSAGAAQVGSAASDHAGGVPKKLKVGSLVYTTDQLSAACNPSGGSSPAAAAGSNSTSGVSAYPTDNYPSTWRATGTVVGLRPGGIALVQCKSESDGYPGSGSSASLLALDVTRGKVRWTYPLKQAQQSTSASSPSSTDTVLTGGSDHVYVLRSTSTPASGLQDAAYSTQLIALDLKSGKQSWQQPVDSDQSSALGSGPSITEFPASTAGKREILLHTFDYSAFDAQAGTALWRVPELDTSQRLTSPAFVGHDLVVGVREDNGTRDLVAENINNKQDAWVVSLADQTSVADGDVLHNQVAHDVIWYFGSSGYDAYAVTTGAQSAHYVYPTEWKQILSTPELTVTNVDGTLRLFKNGSWSVPVWAKPASADAAPVLLDASVVAVSAPAGLVCFSASDGSTLDVPAAVNLGADATDVDGLISTGLGIVAVAQPTG